MNEKERIIKNLFENSLFATPVALTQSPRGATDHNSNAQEWVSLLFFKQVLRHLRKHNCELLREGSRHSIWIRPESKTRGIIPRHSEITNAVAKNIRKNLGIPVI